VSCSVATTLLWPFISESAGLRSSATISVTLSIVYLFTRRRGVRFDGTRFLVSDSSLGGLWLLFLLGYNLSIASAIGFIALAGVSAEFGVIMLIYLDHAIAKRRAANQFNTERDLIEAIEEGAVLRVRPKAMTVTVIIAGLLPIMFGGGTGSEAMRRFAAPMVGGMIISVAPLVR
jgi:Cu(I)/Ag(I) efflux system membrane protein CusA/SilA